MQKSCKIFDELVETIEFLRSEKGCPWDKKQTINNIKTHLIEEVYELSDAIDSETTKNIAEECGDVLLNLIMIANMLKEKGETDIYTILGNLREKIINRHPHVFGEKNAVSADDALINWQQSKKIHEKKSLFNNIPSSTPALERAFLIAKRADKIGFGFENDDDIISKLREETNELIDAIKSKDNVYVEQELGDLLFTIVNLSVLKGLTPQDSLNKSCNKFLKRLQYIENKLDSDGKVFQSQERAYIELLWEESKDKV